MLESHIWGYCNEVKYRAVALDTTAYEEDDRYQSII